MRNLIVYLTIVRETAKDIHYNYRGPDFYGVHLLMDRVADDLLDFVDQIKEKVFMYKDLPIPTGKDVMLEASQLMPETSNINELLEKLKLAIYSIEQISQSPDIDAGDNDLLGRISSDLQTKYALVSHLVKREG